MGIGLDCEFVGVDGGGEEAESFVEETDAEQGSGLIVIGAKRSSESGEGEIAVGGVDGSECGGVEAKQGVTGLGADGDVGVGEKRLEAAKREIGGGDVLEGISGSAADNGIVLETDGASDTYGAVGIEKRELFEHGSAGSIGGFDTAFSEPCFE